MVKGWVKETVSSSLYYSVTQNFTYLLQGSDTNQKERKYQANIRHISYCFLRSYHCGVSARHCKAHKALFTEIKDSTISAIEKNTCFIVSSVILNTFLSPLEFCNLVLRQARGGGEEKQWLTSLGNKASAHGALSTAKQI